MTQFFDCGDPHQRDTAIAAAAAAVKSGRLVVMPTDTVYGLGADAFDSGAVTGLLAAKATDKVRRASERFRLQLEVAKNAADATRDRAIATSSSCSSRIRCHSATISLDTSVSIMSSPKSRRSTMRCFAVPMSAASFDPATC